MCKCFSYFSQNPAPSFLSSKNFSSFARMAILPLCPRAAAALPKTCARCNTARAYPVLQRYNHLHFPISCPTKASFLWLFESPQKWAEMSDRRPRADPSRLLLSEQGGVRQQELLPGDWENIVFLIFFRPFFLLQQSVSMCVFEQVRCIVERCDDGSIAPVPEGQCCPSKRACPAQVLTSSVFLLFVNDMILQQWMISRPLDVHCAGTFLGAKL